MTAFRALALSTVALLAGAPAVAQQPTTPASTALHAWVAAFNSGDSLRLARFVDSTFSPAQFARRPAAFIVTRDRWRRRNLGPIEIVRIESANDTLARALVRNALVESWGHATVQLVHDSTGSLRIGNVDLTRYEPPPAANAAHGRLSDADIARALGAFTRRLADSALLSGTVLVRHHGRTVFESSYGFADEAHHVANDSATRYQLASSAKMFTGVAVLQLAAEGRLSLDDPVARWVPEFANRDAARRVKVRHLLTMSSGLSDFMPSPAFDAADKSQLRGLADYLRFFAADSLAFEPGTEWQYRNSNYLLLGLIAERASGRPWRELWQARVFAPAAVVSAWAPGAAATGYSYYWPGRRLDVDRRRAVTDDAREGTPAGGGVATVSDMARFAEALLDGRLLPPAWRDSMFAGRAPSPGGGAMAAFGFDALERADGVRVLSKGGYVDGALAQVELYPDDDWIVVVLTNTDLWGGEAVAARARALITQR